MSTFTKPSAVVALTLAKDTDINDLADAVEEAFDLIPDETRLERGTTNYVVAAGAGNAYTVSMPKTLGAYVDGYEVVFKANHTNTGAATIDIDGLGAKSLRRQYGEALAAGDIQSGKIVPFRYNTTSGYFEMQLITTGNMTDVGAVAGIAANVTTVSGISANVTTVAGIAANVTTVAGISANVTTVAGIHANVTTVAGIHTDVSTVAGDTIPIGIIAADLVGVDTIGTVAGIAANVTTVSGISANVTTVAGIAANVTTVAGISANVTTVAGIHANVTTVAGIHTDVSTVAGDTIPIGIIAADLVGVDTIGTVAANLAGANTIGTVAGISADVTAVAGDAADIGIVAADLAGADDIGTCADNIADIQTVADMTLLLETAEKAADYTLALADAGKIVAMNKSGAATLTVPANAAVAFPVGSVVGVYNLSSDEVTIAEGGGVTVRNAGNLPQYGEASLRKRGTNEWVLVGDVL